MTTDLRYPIGPFTFDGKTGAAERSARIQVLDDLPDRLAEAVQDLAGYQLDTPYRPGGWTVRQLCHHLADSHMNAYIRFKLALTEDTPAVKPYDQERWAELPEAKSAPIKLSVQLLDALHARWVAMLRAVTDDQWGRAYFHPEAGRNVPLDEVLAHYAWHCRHHVAQITALRAREGW